MPKGDSSTRQPVVLVYHGEHLVRLVRWWAKVTFYVAVGVVMAAMFDQSRLVAVLWRTNNYNINNRVQVQDTMKERASTTSCSASSLSWDFPYSSSSVLPLFQPAPEVRVSSSSSLLKQRPRHNNNNETDNDPISRIDPRKVIFYHVHEAKTAGSSLNRYLARRYHAVCGHKGYSFDQPLHLRAKRLPCAKGTSCFGPDRVRSKDMTARGFHNCRLISHEASAMENLNIIRTLQQEPYGFYVHVVIPCRDVISHRISKCAHKKIETQNWTDITDDEELCGKIISECDFFEDRYTMSYETVANQVTYFWYKNFTQLDRLLDPYVPQRGYPLPDANKVYQTNTQFESDWMQEVTRRCTTRINQYYMEKVELYKQCAKHVPEVHLHHF
jgi:hypothetical protein